MSLTSNRDHQDAASFATNLPSPIRNYNSNSPSPSPSSKTPLDLFRESLSCKELQRVIHTVFRHEPLKYRTVGTLHLLLDKSRQLPFFVEDREHFGVVVGEFFFWFCEDPAATRDVLSANLEPIYSLIVDAAFPTATNDESVRWLCYAIYLVTFNNAASRQFYATRATYERFLASLAHVKSRDTVAKFSLVLLDWLRMSPRNQDLFGTQEFYEGFRQFSGPCADTNFVNALKLIEEEASRKKWELILSGRKKQQVSSASIRDVVYLDNSLPVLVDQLGKAATLADVKKAVDALVLANKISTRIPVTLSIFMKKLPLFETRNPARASPGKRAASPSLSRGFSTASSPVKTARSSSPQHSATNDKKKSSSPSSSSSPSPNRNNSKNDLVALCIGKFFNWFAQNGEGERICAAGGTEGILDVFHAIVHVGFKNAASSESFRELVCAVANVTAQNVDHQLRRLYSTTSDIVSIYTSAIPYLNFEEGARVFSAMMFQLLQHNASGCMCFSQTTEFFDTFSTLERVLKNKRTFVAVQQLLVVEVEKTRVIEHARRKLEQKHDADRKMLFKNEEIQRLQEIETQETAERDALMLLRKENKEMIEERERQRNMARASMEKDEAERRKSILEMEEAGERKIILQEIEKDKRRIADETEQLLKKKQDQQRQEEEEKEATAQIENNNHAEQPQKQETVSATNAQDLAEDDAFLRASLIEDSLLLKEHRLRHNEIRALANKNFICIVQDFATSLPLAKAADATRRRVEDMISATKKEIAKSDERQRDDSQAVRTPRTPRTPAAKSPRASTSEEDVSVLRSLFISQRFLSQEATVRAERETEWLETLLALFLESRRNVKNAAAQTNITTEKSDGTAKSSNEQRPKQEPQSQKRIVIDEDRALRRALVSDLVDRKEHECRFYDVVDLANKHFVCLYQQFSNKLEAIIAKKTNITPPSSIDAMNKSVNSEILASDVSFEKRAKRRQESQKNMQILRSKHNFDLLFEVVDADFSANNGENDREVLVQNLDMQKFIHEEAKARVNVQGEILEKMIDLFVSEKKNLIVRLKSAASVVKSVHVDAAA